MSAMKEESEIISSQIAEVEVLGFEFMNEMIDAFVESQPA